MAGALGWSRGVRAEIVPDAILPQPSIVLPDASGTALEIGGGTIGGRNLFHSFARFGLDLGQRATFVAPPEIDRVLARVTGGDIARIDGTLAAPTDLIFLAPNGIALGDGARLELGGSFLATTASAIEFDDGLTWPSTAVETPLLSVSVPVGLHFEAMRDPATISIRGSGRPATIATTGSLGSVSPEVLASMTFSEPADSRLAVASGRTIALIGGDIQLSRTQLYAPSGQIVLGGVRSGRVAIDDFGAGGTIRFEDAELGGSMHITDRASILSEGAPHGDITIAARDMTFDRGAFALLQNFGDVPGGNLTVTATETLTIDGRVEAGQGSFVSADTFGSGAGGNVAIEAGRLELTQGANINTVSYGAGAAGAIVANGRDDIVLTGFEPSLPAGGISNIGSIAQADGDSGDVAIDTTRLELTDGGSITTLSFGRGRSGNLRVAASESMRVEGSASGTQASTVGTVALAFGDAGDVEVRSPRLTLHAGGQLGSTTAAFGNAGDVTLDSGTEIVLSGRDPVLGGSQILALSESAITSGLIPQDLVAAIPALAEIVPIGNSGNVAISTPRLLVTDGGSIQLANRSLGNAGRLFVTSDFVRIESGSGIEAETFFGTGGGLVFDVGVLELDNSTILTATVNAGRAGDIRIRASDRVEIAGISLEATERETLRLASLGALAIQNLSQGIASGSTGEGAAGAIAINAGTFVLRDGGLIAPAVLGSGDAGRLLVQVTGDAIVDSGVISTATIGQTPDAGSGGEIRIEAENLSILNGGTVGTTSLGFGDAGALRVDVRNELRVSGQSASSLNVGGNLTTGAATLSGTTTGNGGDLSVRARRVVIDDRATISASSVGIGDAGSITIEAERLELADGATVSATSQSGQGGNVSIVADRSVVLREGGQLATQAGRAETGGGNGGNITIDTGVFAAVESSQLAANAFSGSGGNITISARSLFLDETSGIDTSSELGIAGTVALDAEAATVNPNVESLPSEVLAGRTIEHGCSSDRSERLAVAGVARSPEFVRRTPETHPTWHDDRHWRDFTADLEPVAIASEPPIDTAERREATGWWRDTGGDVQLVASSDSIVGLPSPNCTTRR